MKIACLVVFAVLLGNPSTDSPEQKAKKWLESRMKSGLVLVHRVDKGGFVGHTIIGQSAMRYEFQQDGYRISFGFDKKLDHKMDLESIRKSFQYAALDKLPTPGLKVKNWEIKPMTSMSSFKDGVEILDYRDGRIVFRIKTEFFALSGRDRSIEIPADARIPKGSYFQIRKKFKLDLTIDAPIGVK